jgi:hypothetical protein
MKIKNEFVEDIYFFIYFFNSKNEISPRALALKQLKTMFKRLNVTFNNLHEFNEKTIRLKYCCIIFSNNEFISYKY